MHILLLDMDGVLIESKGYHHALQKTVQVWGHALGYSEAILPYETIHHYESVGLTSEWESASVCVALMLLERWEEDPNFQLPSKPRMNPAGTERFGSSAHDEFLSKLDGRRQSAELLQFVEHLLSAGLTEQWQVETISSLVREARYIRHSAVHRTQQEFVLGSDQMRSIYGLAPYFEVPGTLVSDDKPTLSKADRMRLQSWIRSPHRTAVVFTNRPCTPPEGHFDTPEAELGLRAAGLEGLNVIGSGTMGWLSVHQGEPLFAYLKPSAVHALTALLHAAGLDTEEALVAAHAQHVADERVEAHKKLHKARVDVFEDSSSGLESALAVREALQLLGVSIDLHLHGIAKDSLKIRALERTGAQIHSHLSDALLGLPDFPGV